MRFLVLVLLFLALVLLAADNVFNLRSNATYLTHRHSSEPLQVQMADGKWKPASAISFFELHLALRKRQTAPGVTWSTLQVRREATTLAQKAVQTLISSQVNVIEFFPDQFDFATSFQEEFQLTTARDRLKHDDAVFAITANFRDPDGKTMGLVVHEGVQRNPPFPAWSGYFFVKAGKPWFGPKSLFEETPGVLQEASQIYPSIMKNHTVFSYVDLAPNRFFDGNKITYRALAGMRQDGSIVFVLSGNGGIMNVSEVAALAQKLNVQHATLLDGGRALQYSIRLSGFAHHFHAFNTRLEFDHPVLQPQRSPVYITVRPSTVERMPE